MKILKDNFNKIKSYGAARLGGSANRITLKNVKYHGQNKQAQKSLWI